MYGRRMQPNTHKPPATNAATAAAASVAPPSEALARSRPNGNGGSRDFDRMHREYAPRVLGYLRRLTGGDRERAEDLTQEVFLAAYRGRSGYTGRVPPIAWLLGIARRRWRDDARRASPSTAALPEDTAQGTDVEAQVVRAEHLEECLARLDPAARTAILLVLGEGRSYVEAAAALGEPIGTVKWRVHSASRRLRELLTDQEGRGSDETIAE
jgi:RNA polymerase sigma-70 factor (ECF subfamily)